jgi:hypothetical protein
VNVYLKVRIMQTRDDTNKREIEVIESALSPELKVDLDRRGYYLDGIRLVIPTKSIQDSIRHREKHWLELCQAFRGLDSTIQVIEWRYWNTRCAFRDQIALEVRSRLVWENERILRANSFDEVVAILSEVA